MFRLKTLTILGSKAELASLPEGKLLINTVNAHSFNTAKKDHQHIEGDDNDECNQGKEPFFFFNSKYIVHSLIIFLLG